MQYPKVLVAFTKEEYEKAHLLLASRVASMMGRKFEEGDWAFVYCAAKDIPDRGWSNLKIDIRHRNLGVEHKMLRVKSSKPIKEYCGTRLMHPSLTRSIRVPGIEGDPTETAQEVLQQYANLVERRRQRIAENAPGLTPDMRTGWLLWQESLEEFLYFEEEMLPPNPNDYYAEWRESGGGARKKSVTLWVYEKESGKKRYSITTSAGAKIQPYFDVPAPNTSGLYYFRVQGELIDGDYVRIWVTPNTALLLQGLLGNLNTDTVSDAICKYADAYTKDINLEDEDGSRVRIAVPIVITTGSYELLRKTFEGVSDEHRMQLLVSYISE